MFSVFWKSGQLSLPGPCMSSKSLPSALVPSALQLTVNHIHYYILAPQERQYDNNRKFSVIFPVLAGPQAAIRGGSPQAQPQALGPAVAHPQYQNIAPDEPPQYHNIIPNPPPLPVLPRRPPAQQPREDRGLPFDDFYDRICAHMDLQPNDALIGYKFKWDRVCDAPHRLSSAEEYHTMIEITIEIHNLRANANRRRTNKQPTKCKLDETDPGLDSTVSFAAQLWELKEQLTCQKHCVSNDHFQLDIYVLTLWAKKILLNEATFHQPPAMKEFDHLPRKRYCSSLASSSSAPPPPIHIHLGDSILSAQHGQSQSNRIIDLTGNSEPEEDEIIIYPTIGNALREFHEDFPEHNFPQYEAPFLRHGYKHVDDSIGFIHYHYLIDIIQMEACAVNIFLSQAYNLIRCAKKGKGKAIPNEEEKEN
ncbi:hypothetical protein BDQ17DRAFT_1337967 [Cyathus striatus]|nr:hypothetical protein BDQ17DRAFT_1337967 [Cyathus striatus]